MNKNILPYSTIILLIAISGFPFFFDSDFWLISGFLITGAIFFHKNIKFEKSIVLLVCGLLILELLQIIKFGNFNFSTFSAIFIKVFFAYFVVRISGTSFPKYYIRILGWLSIISLFFYIFLSIPGVFTFFYRNIGTIFISSTYKGTGFYSPLENILIYTLDPSCNESFRNPGPFWEPGAYAIFLIFALLFNTIISRKIFNFWNVIFIITILTTTSTSGYLALFLLIAAYFTISISTQFKYVYLGITFIAVYYLYFALDFLDTKIIANIGMATEGTYSRFGSFMADWVLFLQSPFIGWGRGDMRYGTVQVTFFSITEHRNNGISALLTEYGIFFFVFYLLLYYKSFKNLCLLSKFPSFFAIFALLIISLLGFSQTIFTRPFFLGILFLGYTINEILGKKVELKSSFLQ